MARTVATNFTGGLQFPYATAAADLFKKEDVQTLALAVDQHTHGAGLGKAIAPLTAASIPNGLITSAMIADGTIVAGDIADGAITSAKILDGTIVTADLAQGAVTNRSEATGVAINPTTSSTTFVDIPDMAIPGIVIARPSVLRIDFSSVFQMSVVGGLVYVQMDVNGAQPSVGQTAVLAQSNFTASYFPLVMWGYLAVAAGTYTVKAQWRVNAGTGTAYANVRALSCMELRA